MRALGKGRLKKKGVGGLDGPNRQDLLPSGYGPPKPTPGPPYSQGGPSDGMPGADGGQEELTPEQMTPQQWENYQLSKTREETERIRHATVDKSDELVMRSGAGRQMAKEIYANLNIQQNHIDNIEANINKAGKYLTLRLKFRHVRTAN